MKIVIIGAGIAGCAAYLELRKHLPIPSDSEAVHEIIIYEAYSTDLHVTAEERQRNQQDNTHSSTLLVGGGLGIAANGLHVLQRLDEGLLKDVVCSGYAASKFNMKSKNGWQLVSMDATGHALSGKQRMHMIAASRHSLWQALRSRIPDKHIINKRISKVVANPAGKNVIHFVDGSPSVEADLVLGADGVRSTAKRAIFPDSKEDPYPPNYEGLVGVGGFIPSADVKGLVEKGSMNLIFGGNGFFGYFYSESATSDPNRDSPYHVSEPGDRLGWWSTYEIEKCPDRKTLDMADVTRQLRERYSHWKDPVVQKVVQSLKIDHMYPTWTVPPLPTWERDGVVLVGDAAHALPPSSGQGSSQALEDVEAFVLLLSHHLRKKGDGLTEKAQNDIISKAASQYMALRKPHVTKILKHAQQGQNKKRDMGAIQEYSMYAVLKIMGLFPGVMAGQLQKVINYNIAEEVAKITASEP